MPSAKAANATVTLSFADIFDTGTAAAPTNLNYCFTPADPGFDQVLFLAIGTHEPTSGGSLAATVTDVDILDGSAMPIAGATPTVVDLDPVNADTGVYPNNGDLRLELWWAAIPDGYTGQICVDIDFSAGTKALAATYLFTGVDASAPAFQFFAFNNSQSTPADIQALSGGAVFYASMQDSAADAIPAVAPCPDPIGTSPCALASMEETTDDPGGGNTRNGRLEAYALANPDAAEGAGFTFGNNATWVQLGVSIQPVELTSVGLSSFTAERYAERDGTPGTLLRWRTGFEADNLGFRVYREDADGKRVRVTPGIVAGSALFARGGLSSGYSYSWWDAGGDDSSTYWLEDVDLRGATELHGPFRAHAKSGAAPAVASSALLGKASGPAAAGSRLYTGDVASLNGKPNGNGSGGPKGGGASVQWALASQPSVKLSVREAGWYRVTGAELAAAGFNTAGVNPRAIRLFADGVELPIRVIGEEDGRLDPADAVEFFGSGVDVATTDTRVYWLTAANGAGKRVKVSNAAAQNGVAQSFPATVELDERLVYFAGLANGDKENFFGEVLVDGFPVDQRLTLPNVDPAGATARVEVALQGVTVAPHAVSVALNGQPVGQLSFSDLGARTSSFTVPHSLLVSGDNVVTLTAAGGDLDVSVVDYVRITYTHAALADQNALFFNAASARTAVTIGGFTSPQVRVVDVTSAGSVQEYAGTVASGPSGFAVTLQIPTIARRQLYAFTPDRVKSPASIELNAPSQWFNTANAADIAIVTHGEFAGAAAALRQLRESQGYRVAVVDVEDLYDEFAFGYHTPLAVKAFVQQSRSWRAKPRFLTLLGDASYDPRDYFGVGSVDFVPTKLVDTAFIEAASDDWLADLNGDEIPELAVGRLPARTAAEAQALVGKIVAYEQSAQPNPTALFVADIPDAADFEAQAARIQSLLPGTFTSQQISRRLLGDAAARAQVLAGLADGPGVVHYSGHGSVDLWRGGLLLSSDAAGLGNGDKLSLVTISNCLNGYIADPFLESLGESLVKAPNGGAVAVWSSSGATFPTAQQLLAEEFYRLLFSGQNLTIGEAAARAKASVGGEVRRTWVLVGDPATRLK